MKALTQTGEGFAVTTADGERCEAKTVIAATGASPKLLGVPGENSVGVSYCAVCDGAFYAGKDVLVVGGGDTAVEDALYLASICHQVLIAIRSDRFRGVKTRADMLKTLDNVRILTNTTVTEIRGDERLSAALLRQDGKIWEQPVDGVFLAVGSQPSTAYMAGLPVLTPDGYVLADETGKTQIPGLFVAGDIRKKALRQVITAAADGANAAASAAAYLLA